MNLSKRSEDKQLFSGTLVKKNRLYFFYHIIFLYDIFILYENTMNLSERSEDKELLSGVLTKDNTSFYHNLSKYDISIQN
jgi:hypothetical protein